MFAFRYYNIYCDNLLHREARRDMVVETRKTEYLAYPREGWHVVLHGHLHLPSRIHLYAHLVSSKYSGFRTSLRSLSFIFDLQPFVQLIPAM